MLRYAVAVNTTERNLDPSSRNDELPAGQAVDGAQEADRRIVSGRQVHQGRRRHQNNGRGTAAGGHKPRHLPGGLEGKSPSDKLQI